MKQTRVSVRRRIAALTGALAVGVVGMVGFAGAASADDAEPSVTPANINPSSSASLTIHKYAGAGTTAGDGNILTPPPDRTPVQDVVFTIYPLNGVDLTTSAGWTTANAIAAGVATSGTCAIPSGVTGVTLGTGQTVTTNASGLASQNLPVGAYLVCETFAPVYVTGKAAPFVVTLPHPNQGAWNYTVHVYPKNLIGGGGDKTVTGPETPGLGSNVQWTVTSKPLGSFGDGKALTAFGLYDQLDSRLTFIDTVANPLLVTYTTPGGSATAVPAGNLGTASVVANLLTLNFTTAGVQWVNTLPAGTIFTYSFWTTVTGVGSGDIQNAAYLNVNGQNVENGSASTQWGDARILKFTGTENKVLAGAEFQVFASEAAAQAKTGAISVNGTSTFISDSNGVVHVAGLWVGNDGTPTSRDYWIVETKAPGGYVLNSTPIKITVTPGTLATGVWSAKVSNVQTEGPKLPLTGASGTVAMSIGGILLILVGGGAALASRRRSHEAE